MKKFILIVVGVVAAAVGIIAFIGSRLPRDHEATMTLSIAVPQDQVWSAIADVRSYPAWRKDLKSVEIVTPAPLTWKEDGSAGPMTLAVESWAPPSRMVARITDEGLPFGGSWEYVLAPDTAEAGRTRVTITEHGWVANPIFRFASKYVMGHHASIDSYLRALALKFGKNDVPAKVTGD